MRENKDFNIMDEIFDKKLLNLIDLAEKKFPNDKMIQDKIKNLKHILKKQTRKVKLNEINKNNECQ